MNSPARYLYIAALGANGENMTSSVGDVFKVTVVSTVAATGKKQKLKVNLQDRGDGSYSAQYFFNSPSTRIQVSITSGGRHLAESPYTLKGPIPTEQCSCPREPSQFFRDYDCSKSDPAGQIDNDMARHPDGITREAMDAAIISLKANNTALIHYTFKDNRVYSVNHGQYGGFQKFFDEIVFSLRRRVILPDMELLLNMGDWPQSPKRDPLTGSVRPALPLVSWCGSTSHYDMLLPTYKLVLATVFGKDLENVMTTDGDSYVMGGGWSNKSERLYFRGRPSNAVRTDAAVEAKHWRELDVAITRNHFNYFPNDEARAEHAEYERTYGKKSKRSGFSEAFKNKYQLNIDGTVAAYRLPALIAGNSVMFKQKSDYYEHFYQALKPWEHFIPLERDVSDIPEKMMWAKSNDARAEAIGQRARRFARSHLTIEDIYCYHHLAFTRLAALQLFEPTIHPEMEERSDVSIPCECPKRQAASRRS